MSISSDKTYTTFQSSFEPPLFSFLKKKFHFNQTAVFQLLLSVLGYLHSSSHLKEWQPTRTFVRESPKLATSATSKVLRYQKGRKQLTANSATSTGANFRTDIIIELFHLLTKCLGRKNANHGSECQLGLNSSETWVYRLFERSNHNSKYDT